MLSNRKLLLLPFGEQVAGWHLASYGVIVSPAGDAYSTPGSEPLDLAVIEMASETKSIDHAKSRVFGLAYGEFPLYWARTGISETLTVEHLTGVGLEQSGDKLRDGPGTWQLILVSRFAVHECFGSIMQVAETGGLSSVVAVLAFALECLMPVDKSGLAVHLQVPSNHFPTIIKSPPSPNLLPVAQSLGVHCIIRIVAAVLSSTSIVFVLADPFTRTEPAAQNLVSTLFVAVTQLAWPFELICPFFFLPSAFDCLDYHDAFVAAVCCSDTDIVSRLRHALVINVQAADHLFCSSVISEPKSPGFESMCVCLAPVSKQMHKLLFSKSAPSNVQLILRAHLASAATRPLAGIGRCLLGRGSVIDFPAFDRQQTWAQRRAWRTLKGSYPFALFVRAVGQNERVASLLQNPVRPAPLLEWIHVIEAESTSSLAINLFFPNEPNDSSKQNTVSEIRFFFRDQLQKSLESKSTESASSLLLLARILYELKIPSLFQALIQLNQYPVNSFPGFKNKVLDLWHLFSVGLKQTVLSSHTPEPAHKRGLSFCVTRETVRSRKKDVNISRADQIGCFNGFEKELQTLQEIMEIFGEQCGQDICNDIEKIFTDICTRKKTNIEQCVAAAASLDSTACFVAVGSGMAANVVSDVLVHFSHDSQFGMDPTAVKDSVFGPFTSALFAGCGPSFANRTKALLRNHTGAAPGSVVFQEPLGSLKARIDRIAHCYVLKNDAQSLDECVQAALTAAAKIRAWSVAFDVPSTCFEVILNSGMSWLQKSAGANCSIHCIAFFVLQQETLQSSWTLMTDRPGYTAFPTSSLANSLIRCQLPFLMPPVFKKLLASTLIQTVLNKQLVGEHLPRLSPFPWSEAHPTLAETVRSVIQLNCTGCFAATLFYWHVGGLSGVKIDETSHLQRSYNLKRVSHAGLADLAARALISGSPHCGLVDYEGAFLEYVHDQLNHVTILLPEMPLPLVGRRQLSAFCTGKLCVLEAIHSLVDAVSHLHSMGIACGSLCPENLFVVHGGPSVLTRLMIGCAGAGSSSTEAAFYRAPEFNRGGHDAPRLQLTSDAGAIESDVYAIGWVTWSLILGRTIPLILDQQFQFSMDSLRKIVIADSPEDLHVLQCLLDINDGPFCIDASPASLHTRWLLRHVWHQCAGLRSNRPSIYSLGTNLWTRLKWTRTSSSLLFEKRFKKTAENVLADSYWLANKSVSTENNKYRRPYILIKEGIQLWEISVDLVACCGLQKWWVPVQQRRKRIPARGSFSHLIEGSSQEQDTGEHGRLLSVGGQGMLHELRTRWACSIPVPSITHKPVHFITTSPYNVKARNVLHVLIDGETRADLFDQQIYPSIIRHAIASPDVSEIALSFQFPTAANEQFLFRSVLESLRDVLDEAHGFAGSLDFIVLIVDSLTESQRALLQTVIDRFVPECQIH